MSEDEQDDDKNFLSRWSQRKREAKLQEPAVPAAEEKEALPTLNAENAVEAPFDLSSLPKLEDITEATDITAFLRKGVPESLRNEALRKAWALDPAIRNYVNPALDYAYDWNTPGGVPGNGELAAGTDIAKMVLQIMGNDPETSGSRKLDAAASHSGATETASLNLGISAPEGSPPDLPNQQLTLSDSVSAAIPVSAENENRKQAQVESSQAAELTEFDAPQQQVRRHGTAKPRI